MSAVDIVINFTFVTNSIIQKALKNDGRLFLLYCRVFVCLEDAYFEKAIQFVETCKNISSIFDEKDNESAYNISGMQDKKHQINCMVDDIKNPWLLCCRF